MSTGDMGYFSIESDASFNGGTGPGTGTFVGHAIPALCFTLAGAGILALALKRARRLSPPLTFAEAYIPEKNPTVLFTAGFSVMILTVLVFFIAGTHASLQGLGFFHALPNQTMYLSFAMVGYIAVLESKRKVPSDSMRVALAMALLIASQLMYWNGQVVGGSDQVAHDLLSQLHLFNALVVAYSVICPQSVIAYVGGYGLLLVTGTWYATLGLYACCIDMTVHNAGAWLCLQALFVAFVIIATASCYMPTSAEARDERSHGSSWAGAGFTDTEDSAPQRPLSPDNRYLHEVSIS